MAGAIDGTQRLLATIRALAVQRSHGIIVTRGSTRHARKKCLETGNGGDAGLKVCADMSKPVSETLSTPPSSSFGVAVLLSASDAEWICVG